MSKLKIEYLDIGKININPKNPRKNDQAVDTVAKSIKEFEWKTPIVVANTQWDLPENLIKWVKEERMINGLIDMCHSLTPEESVGFAEVVAYLNPATNQAPLRSDVTEIYLYCVTQMMKIQKIEVPKDIAVDKISDHQMEKLNDLKKWIYKQRGGKEKNPIINALKEVFKNSQK